jgi:hypothetical protein
MRCADTIDNSNLLRSPNASSDRIVLIARSNSRQWSDQFIKLWFSARQPGIRSVEHAALLEIVPEAGSQSGSPGEEGDVRTLCALGRDGMKRIAKPLLAVLLVGCAHKSLLQEETDAFVGKPVSSVAARIGPPAEEHEIEGGMMHVWSSDAQGKCTIRAIVRGGVIGSLDWEGTEGQCANYALMLKGSGCRNGVADLRMWLPACIDRDKSQ